jgi:hypothetical protein
MSGGLESRCVGRVCGADGAVQLVLSSWGVVRVSILKCEFLCLMIMEKNHGTY